MKLSKELLTEVSMYTDTIYSEELDTECVEDLIKDLLKHIDKLNEHIDDINSENEIYESSYLQDREFMYSNRIC